MKKAISQKFNLKKNIFIIKNNYYFIHQITYFCHQKSFSIIKKFCPKKIKWGTTIPRNTRSC